MTDSSRFIFLADMQLGAYATFSGLSEAEAAGFLSRGMLVSSVPRVEGFEWDASRYQAAIAAINSIEPDFVVVGGDMIDDPSSPDQLAALLRITKELKPSIDVHWVPGNHDIAPDTVAPTTESIERYREVFGADYYAFGRNGTRFVVLNTVVLDRPENVPDHLAQQFEFLENELKTSRDADHIVLFGHHPLFVDSPDEPDSYWNIPLDRRKRLLGLIRQYGVEVAFAGHLHRNAEARDGRFLMVTSGPVGYPLGEDPSGLRLVSITPEGITHEYHPIVKEN